jgi:hypothetical protein
MKLSRTPTNVVTKQRQARIDRMNGWKTFPPRKAKEKPERPK